jgi:hypothetical protein
VLLTREDHDLGSPNLYLPSTYLASTPMTVRIPEYGEGALHIAVWPGDLNPIVPEVLAVNFFDFSQEPDHEWIEIVNVADYELNVDAVATWMETGDPAARLALEEQLTAQAIDLSGWQLRVGKGSASEGLFTIPQDTRIAPGGSLLLGFNAVELGTDLLNSNNIALTGEGPFANATVPPIPVNAPGGIPYPDGSAARSVFRLNGGEDFVDADGDGLPDAFSTEYFVRSTVRAAGGGPNQAFDRIVQLDSEDPILTNTTTPADLANVVLGGGFLPNYPERDGVDNDRDGGILMTDRVDNNRNALFVNGGGALYPFGIDEDGEGIDENGPSGLYWDEDGFFYDITTSQFHTPRTFTFTYQPAYPNPTPGAYSRLGLNYTSHYFSFYDDPDNDPLGLNFPPYLASFERTPNMPYEWKAYVERQFFPGDAVFVTLYEGPAERNRIADRVTYEERDVVNRAIDDLGSCPYQIIDINGVVVDSPTLDGVPGSRLWPDNTMGIDFYRSLERKHPLYHGDLRGTTNRWEATDGNYDDWGAPVSNLMVRKDPVLYGHAYNASPLRMNYWQRVRENYQASDSATPHDPYAVANPGVDGSIGQTNPVSAWQYRVRLPDGTYFYKPKVGVRNRPFESMGNVMELPVFSMEKRYSSNRASATEFLNGVTMLFAPYRPPELLHPMAGEGLSLDVLAVLNNVVEDPLVLTAAQAEFQANPNDVVTLDAEANWGFAAGQTLALPQTWAPVHLFGSDGVPPLGENRLQQYGLMHALSDPVAYPHQHGLLELAWLLDPNQSLFAAGLSEPVARTMLNPRWGPMTSRVMYVSGNHANFVQPLGALSANTSQGDWALFVWRGVSGLVDGKYDVFVEVSPDLSPLLGLHGATNSQALTEFGRTLILGQPNHVRQQDLRVGVKFFTDATGFKRNAPVRFDQPGDVAGELPGTGLFNVDIFSPDASGRVHYGEVDVRNNYLAMLLGNYSNPGEFVRFSRVILTPSKRTEGRINVNTAHTRVVTNSQDNVGINPTRTRVFNPFIGIPGVMLDLAQPYPLSNQLSVIDRSPRPGLQLLADSDDPVLDREIDYRSIDPPLRRDVTNRADRMVAGRREYADGRYYKWVPQLLGYFDGPNVPTFILTQNYPQFAFEYNQQELWFNELKQRYPRLANMVTTRSDVFEIIVTVQGGFVIDENGDGVLNYRDDREFNVLSEKKVRTVYERR